MKYYPTIDLSTFPRDLVAHLQPGQWVSLGRVEKPEDRGRFWGVKPGGTIVVAWQGNARGRGKGGYQHYQQAIRQYASN